MADETKLRYSVAMGAHVGASDPSEHQFKAVVKLTESKLIELLTKHEFRKNKDGRYITRPMGADGKRTDANALPWALIPLDIDELQANEVPLLTRWAKESKLKATLNTTFSHTPAVPKIRIWLFASRPINADEHAFVHRALSTMVPFKLDPCMTKPSQPVFTPSCPPENRADAFSLVFDGELLDVDKVLEGYRSEIEESVRRRAERATGVTGTGVRQPGGLIDYFNNNYDLEELIGKHGYRRKTRNRYISPGSHSGRAAVVLSEHSLISFHEPDHCVLASRNKYGQAIVLDTFAVYCRLEHADHFDAAIQQVAKWSRAHGWTDDMGPAAAAAQPAGPPPTLLNPKEVYGMLKPQDMLIESILDQGSVVICSGDSNSGKTTILQLMALQVAMGQPFSNKRTKKGKVLWIAGEDMENAKYRIVAMCEEYGIDPVTLGDELLILPQPVAILDQASMGALREAVEQRLGEGVELLLIVVDSKSVNWGGIDENSNDENANFITATRKHLIDPFGRPSVMITHHLTKQRDKEARTSRGGGALINNADHEFRFEMNQDAKLSMMMPGSKVRMERWAELRFEIKTVELPVAKFPLLANNFGEMPRVSIAAPVNQYNRSMAQVARDVNMAKVLNALHSLEAMQDDTSASRIAQVVGWDDANAKPDYRRVNRLLGIAEKQLLVALDADGKTRTLTEAGLSYALQGDAETSADIPA